AVCRGRRQLPPLRWPTRARPAKNDHIRRVIVPVDGSKLAEIANPWAAGLARMLKAQLIFLHVYPTGTAGMTTRAEETFDALRERMVRLCQQLRQSGIKAR